MKIVIDIDLFVCLGFFWVGGPGVIERNSLPFVIVTNFYGNIHLIQSENPNNYEGCGG